MNRVGIRLADSVRLMTTIKIAFVVSELLFVYIVVTIPAQGRHPADLPFEAGLLIAAVTAVALGFLAPRIFGRAPIRKTHDRSVSTAPNRWLAVNLMSIAFFESSSLFGVALHFDRGNVQLVALLLAMGIISTIVWRPGAPPASGIATPSQG